MTDPPCVLGDSTWETIRDLALEVAVLPWGATEAHNRHLPYATDTIETTVLAALAAERAWRAGARVLVLPAVPFGVNTGQREVPFCLNVNPATQAALLADLAASLEPHGVRKLVVLNGHGGNDFRQIIRELQPRTRLLLCQVNWYQCVDPEPFFTNPGDHAGELETSVMMAVAPELVRPLSTAGPGHARRFRVGGFREGWAWTPRHWVRVTDDTGVGDPSPATREKGERFVEAVVERLAGFLVELGAANPDELYE